MSVKERNNPTNWERRLKGETVAVVEDVYEFGYYRIKSRDRTTWLALRSYIASDGTARWVLDGERVQPNFNQWMEATKNPITEELYDAVITGDPWPDLNEVVTRLHNNPPDTGTKEGCLAAINELAEEAKRLIRKGAAKTQEEADQAARVSDELAAHHRLYDKLREQEKAKPLEECRRIDLSYKAGLVTAEIYKQLKQVCCMPWLAYKKAEKDKQEAEARRLAREAAETAKRAQEEAHRKAQEAARTGAAAAEQAAIEQAAKADAAVRTAAEAAQTARSLEQDTVTAGTLGRRAVHLRMRKVYKFDGPMGRAAMLEHFKDRVEIDAVLLKLAEMAHSKAGITVPGLKIDEEPMAA